jgi:hypothetical protein
LPVFPGRRGGGAERVVWLSFGRLLLRFHSCSPVPELLDGSPLDVLAVCTGAAVNTTVGKFCWAEFDSAVPKKIQQKKWRGVIVGRWSKSFNTQ